jgi:hypothetical protein
MSPCSSAVFNVVMKSTSRILPMRVKISDVALGDAQPPPRSEGRCIPLLQIYRMSTQTDRLLV